ncbi:unnamed protein product [Sphagnum balticum]
MAGRTENRLGGIYEELKSKSQLAGCKDEIALDRLLLELGKKYRLEYRSSDYMVEEEKYGRLRGMYRKDKDLLASLMTSLQGRQRGDGLGKVELLRQYNQDVRTMR